MHDDSTKGLALWANYEFESYKKIIDEGFFSYYKSNDGNGMNSVLENSGFLACFCDINVIKGDYDYDHSFEVFGKDEGVKLCNLWKPGNLSYYFLLENAIKFIVIGLNLLVRIILMVVSDKMGLNNESQKF
jgi:hypothetical protein